MTGWFVAQDTFSADLPDGSQVTVVKGSTWRASHYLVKLDAGRDLLFRPLDPGEEAPPPPRPRARSRVAGGNGGA